MQKQLDSKKLELAQKLKRLRDHESASVGEAAAAAAKLQALLLEHNIDEATLEYAAGEKPEYGTTVVDVTRGGLASLLKWKGNLLHFIGMHNNVYAVIIVDLDWDGNEFNTGRMRLVGTEQNISVVKQLYAWLATEVIRLGERDWPKYRTENPRRLKRMFLDQFYRGAADEIYWRLKAQRDVDKKAHAAQWGLVLLQETELTAAVVKYAPDRKEGKADKIRGLDAYIMGRKAAKGIPFGQEKIGEGEILALRA